MVTAVIAAPVPPATIAAMPMIAPVVAVTPSIGCTAATAAPKAPPIVAPMNSEGEKSISGRRTSSAPAPSPQC